MADKEPITCVTLVVVGATAIGLVMDVDVDADADAEDDDNVVPADDIEAAALRLASTGLSQLLLLLLDDDCAASGRKRSDSRSVSRRVVF